MPATRYKKPSISWRPRRRSLFITLFTTCILSLILALPWLMRSNHDFINQQIKTSRSLTDSKREQVLTQLLRASGGDSRVGEELASFYSNQHRYTAAATVYTQTNPPQWLKAAELFALQYDFKATERAAAQAARNTPEGYSWLVRAYLNQNKVEQACQEIGRAPASQQADLSTACTLARQANSSRPDIYRLRDLGVPVLAAERLASLEQKTTADWLFLGDTAWRQGRYDQVAHNLEQAFQQNPWDRDVLTSIQDTCKNQSNNEINIKSVCEKYDAVAAKNLSLLLQ